MNESNGDKRVIGLYGEMRLAMALHKRGWQVFRAYIDETFDFVILKTYCENCKSFKNAWTKETIGYKGKKGNSDPKNVKAVTNLCETCKNDSLKMLVRFIQVKTSEGSKHQTSKTGEETKQFDFHAKIRYHLADSRVFYAWIQVWDSDEDKGKVNFYIFKTEDVSRFDDIQLDAYQITDNQKLRLKINEAGKIIRNRIVKHDFSAFEEFHNNFDCLDTLIDGDDWK